MRVAVLTLAPLLLFACGSPDITGIYQTTSASFDRMSCEARTATTSPAFFLITTSNFLGVEIQTIRGCSAADAATCDVSGPRTFSAAPLTLGTSDGWEGGGEGAFGGGGTCTYSRSEIVATLADDGTITVVASAREIDGQAETCEIDDVPDDLPCVEAQSVTGRRVGDAPPASDGIQLGL